MTYLKKLIYCFVVRRIWRWSYKVLNWAEDRRPGGGFRPENLNWSKSK